MKEKHIYIFLGSILLIALIGFGVRQTNSEPFPGYNSAIDSMIGANLCQSHKGFC